MRFALVCLPWVALKAVVAVLAGVTVVLSLALGTVDSLAEKLYERTPEER